MPPKRADIGRAKPEVEPQAPLGVAGWVQAVTQKKSVALADARASTAVWNRVPPETKKIGIRLLRHFGKFFSKAPGC